MIPGFLLQEGSIAVLRSLLQTGITISSTFSYYSVEKESVDCDEAKRILELLHIPLTLYSIPFIADELMDSELKTEIIQHNNA